MLINMTNDSSVRFFNSILDDEYTKQITVKCEDGTIFEIDEDAISNKFVIQNSESYEEVFLLKEEIIGYLFQFGDTIEMEIVTK